MFSSIDPRVFLGFAGIFGLLIGSFLNVVIYRLPRGESIVYPGSKCPGCDRPIAPWDNVPVVSWLLLRGRCRRCKEPISLRYPAVESLCGAIFVLIAWRYGIALETPLLWAFAAALIVAAAVDIDHQIIPDEISLGGLAFAVAVVPVIGWWQGGDYLRALGDSLFGGLVGGGSLWVVAFVHARVSAATGRRYEHWPEPDHDYPKPNEADYWLWFPGLGLGDVKLLAMIGAVIGPIGVLDTIMAASLLGLVMGIAWGVARRSMASPFGFGPAIAAGALLAVLAPRLWLGFIAAGAG